VPKQKLYVGNLSRSVDDEQLRELFSHYGEVRQIKIIKGSAFGFVEMVNETEAETAINKLNGSIFKGLTLEVNKVRSQKKKFKRRY